MGLRQLAGLVRRHIFVVCSLAMITVAIAAYFKHTDSVYQEAGVIALEPGSFKGVGYFNVDNDYRENSSLITVCQMVSSAVSFQVSQAESGNGGTADSVVISVVNSSNADTPKYSYPELALSVSGADSPAVRYKWGQVVRLIDKNISRWQNGLKVSAANLISPYVLSDSGAIAIKGSLIRSWAGLLFISLIASFIFCRTLDGRPRTNNSVRNSINSSLRCPLIGD